MTTHRQTNPPTDSPSADHVRRGELIAQARRAVGLTQAELADEIGVSLWTVENIEQGRLDAERHLGSIARATLKPEQQLALVARAVSTRSAVGWFEPSGPDDGATIVEPAARPSGMAHLLPAPWVTGRRLILGSIAILVLIRFLTETVPVLPRFGNFADTLIFLVLVGVAIGRRPDLPSELTKAPFIVPVLIFLCLCVLSALVNLSRVAPGPVILFLYGFLGPLGVYYAAGRLWPVGNVHRLSRLLVALGIVQFAVVLVVDLPRFLSTRNPDDIGGTFGFNPYQLVIFLIVFASLVAGIATFESARLTARLAPLLIAASFLVTFLAQYRALLVTTALSAVAVGFLLRTRGRGLLVASFVVVAFIGALTYVSARFPLTKYEPAVSALRSQPTSLASPRLAAAGDVLKLYGERPLFMLTGTGPGTYSSRAWRTFALIRSTSRTDSASPYVSALTGGRGYHTDVSDRYVLPRYQHAPAVLGSRVLSQPFSSYLALLAEVGLGGFLLMVGLYVGGLIRASRLLLATMRDRVPQDPLPAVLLASAIGFFVLLQIAVLENWWEAARVTFPIWMMLAIAEKEFKARASSRR